MKIDDLNDKAGHEVMSVSSEDKSVSFTTDTSLYQKYGELEEALDLLHKNLGVVRFEISVHRQSGDPADKDITVYQSDFDTEPFDVFARKAVDYIQRNFYNVEAE